MTGKIGKAKKANVNYNFWMAGEYTTNPPKNPVTNSERQQGHYIDAGGTVPGVNVCEIDINTFCERTEFKDKAGAWIYENDLLIWESKKEFAYYVVYERNFIDFINGEIVDVAAVLDDVKVIGNTIDDTEFIEGMQYDHENGFEVPYLPVLNTALVTVPYMRLVCRKCKKDFLSCNYQRIHKNCGGHLAAGYATNLGYKKTLA